MTPSDDQVALGGIECFSHSVDALSETVRLAALSCAMAALKIDIEKCGTPTLTLKPAEIEKLLSESVNQVRDVVPSLALAKSQLRKTQWLPITGLPKSNGLAVIGKFVVASFRMHARVMEQWNRAY